MEYMTCQCSWEDDISLRHVISEETVLPWHGQLYKQKIKTKRQRTIEEDACTFNMGVGINLPFRFSHGCGKGGFGLAAGEHDARSFDKIWLERGQEIIQLTALFDTLVRERNPNTMLRLTPREKECLKWLSAGLRPQQIADRLGNAYRTVEKQIASARHKLNARSNEQAVAKVLIYVVLDL